MAAGWASAAGSLISSGLSFLGGQQTNQANANLNSANMAFQQRMRDTAMQSRVNDLKAAGLNPILAAGALGGAAQPGFSPIPMQNRMAQAAPQVGQAVSSALDATIKAAQAKNIDADTANKQGRPGTPGEKVAIKDIATANNLQQATQLAVQQTQNAVADLQLKKIDIAAKAVSYDQAVEVFPSVVQLARTQAQLLQMGVPEAKVRQDMFNGPLGKYLPFLDEAAKAVGVAGGFMSVIKQFLPGR